MFVEFKRPAASAPRAKKAEAEILFTEAEGQFLNGLKLVGLDVWEKRDGSGVFLSLPGRSYQKNGETKQWDFLRYQKQDDSKQLENLKALILEQYHDWAQSQG